MPLFLPTTADEEILGSYRQIFQTIKLDIAFTIDDLSVEGDVAHALTRSGGHTTQVGSGNRGPESNRELFVFARRNGEWNIARYKFNKTNPAGA